MKRSSTFALIVLVLALASLPTLAGCGATPTATAAPTKAASTVAATQAVATKAPTAASTTAPATATAAPTAAKASPTVGGTLVYQVTQDYATLDAHQALTTIGPLKFLGASLITNDSTGKYIPYLAESWKVSDDGLTWEFKLKKGIKFHDGTPCNAEAFAWTFQRAVDPAIKSPFSGGFLAGMTSAKALDELTLQVTLDAPNYYFLAGLSDAGSSGGFMQPLSKAAVEKYGENYGRNPVGVGPYKFKEWVTGTSVTLERNPDFTWAPSYAHQGPYYIQSIKFLILPEMVTTIAGLESDDIDYATQIAPKDLPRLKAVGNLTTFGKYWNGMYPAMALNLTKAPFDDVRVRQALNYAVDRESMIKVLADGIAQVGPLSPNQEGYWPDAGKVAYKFDAAKAKSLLTDAGYSLDSQGRMQKGGTPLVVNLKIYDKELMVRVAQILQEQYKSVGIGLNISRVDEATLDAQVCAGDFESAMFAIGMTTSQMLDYLFDSKMIGTINPNQLNDPKMDALLAEAASATDTAKHLQAVYDIQRMAIEQAYYVYVYVPTTIQVLNTRVIGATFDQFHDEPILNDAYLATK